jgi:uncharacterized integral membrane protein (TIGR00698 family)
MTTALNSTGQSMTRSLTIALGAGLIAVGVNALVPLVSPLLLALILGAVVTNTALGSHSWLSASKRATTLTLRLGVALLGLKLSLHQLAGLGVSGIVVILATVAVTVTSTLFIGKRMGVEKDLTTLIAAGFSICGAAAIAAVDDAVRAKQKFVALAVALVTVFGSLMIVVLPVAAYLLHLSQRQAAVWAGASIHEVAQVVAAASFVGGSAVALAMSVKLGRVLLLAPVYSAVAARSGTRDGKRPAIIPWFVAAFGILVLVSSTGVLPAQVLNVTGYATNLLLAAAMFGLGMGVRVAELLPVPWKALGLAAVSTLVASSVSLVLIEVLM